MRLYILLAILLSLFFSAVDAKTFTYWQVHHMPKSLEKDYYIWRLLSQSNTTKQEARNIIYEASHLNKKLRTVYRKKTGLIATLPKVKATGPVDNSWRARSKAHKNLRKNLLENNNDVKLYLPTFLKS